MMDLSHFTDAATWLIIIPLLTFYGLYLTLRLRGLQFTQFWKGITLLTTKDESTKGSITHFEAISTVLAGNLGTGNISGMAVALSTGGPGSIVWMWIMASLGAIIKYAGCLLGVYYRIRTPQGEYVGGPMYYLTKGLNLPILAKLFSVFAIFSAFTVGNLVQTNSIALPLKEFGLSPFLISVVISVCIGSVIIGGIKRLAAVAATLVPIMGTVYLITALMIIFNNLDQVPAAFSLIFQSAFYPQSCIGGVCGFTVMKVISTGFERGVFATDAGTGIAAILQSGAKTHNPKEEGIVAITAPFFVMAICTITTLVLIITGAWTKPSLESSNMCVWAFEQGTESYFGGWIVLTSLVLFAFTTILAWAACAEKSITFLFGNRALKWFYISYILFIPLGVIGKAPLIWSLADISILAMVSINLLGLIKLRRKIIEETVLREV